MSVSAYTLLGALDRLSETHREIAALAGRDLGGWGKRLVALRKRLSNETFDLGRMSEPYFLACEDAQLAGEYRRRFSEMRASAALHQAVWPAVKILSEADGYLESALRLREAHENFDGWLRAMLRSAVAVQQTGVDRCDR